MYDLVDYAAMISNARRVEAYTAALRAAIKPGSLVIEVGTGIGAFAVIAKRLGARRVIAIEPNDAIAVARLVARENGVEDGIEFVQALARDFTPAERADVVVADLRGALPIATTYLESMIDARERFLAAGGTLIPAVDSLRGAVVEVPDLYNRRCPTVVADGVTVSISSLERFTRNAVRKASFEAAELLTSPETWAEIDYRMLSSPDVSGRLELTVSRRGIGHGIAVWFDTTLIEDVTVSNAPGTGPSAWGRFFFTWTELVPLQAGDRVFVDISARYIHQDYVWRWDTEIQTAAERSETPKRFSQSSFLSSPFVPAQLRKRSGEFVPDLSLDGRIEQFVLQAIDGETTSADIATRLRDQFPSEFPHHASALTRVGEIVGRVSKS